METDKLAAELIEPYLMNLEGYPKIRFISQESCLETMRAYHEARLKEELVRFYDWLDIEDKADTWGIVEQYYKFRK